MFDILDLSTVQAKRLGYEQPAPEVYNFSLVSNLTKQQVIHSVMISDDSDVSVLHLVPVQSIDLQPCTGRIVRYIKTPLLNLT